MDDLEYARMARVEDRHWWYQGMEVLSRSLLDRFAPATSGGRLLDAGCGTGGALATFLSQYGMAFGCDVSAVALSFDKSRRLPRIARATVTRLPFPDEAFDGVVACLVFEHVDDVDAGIAEIARVLRVGGRFAFFLNHPLLQTPGSGWIDDQILDPPEQYWRIGPYLTEQATVEAVEKGVHIRFVHRPLSRYVNAMAAHGLLLERMEEPAPPPGFLDRAPEYTEAATIPRLLLLQARRH